MNLKNVRKNKNLTQKELAAKLNLDQSKINKYEKNIILPNIVILKKIAQILDCSIDDLLKDTG